MLSKTIIILAAVLALGSAPLSTTAFARDGGGGGGHAGGGFGGGHSGGGRGGHVAGGGEGRIGGSHETRHHSHTSNELTTLSNDANCYQIRRYHTPTGWHTRYVYTCD